MYNKFPLFSIKRNKEQQLQRIKLMAGSTPQKISDKPISQ